MLNFPLSFECDDATLLWREWPALEADDVTLPGPFPVPGSPDNNGISFIESVVGLSTSGVDVSELSRFVLFVAVVDILIEALLALDSR